MRKLQESIRNTAQETGFNGVAAISIPGRDPIQETFGLRDIANKLPVLPDTRFGIASGTKTITAMTALSLAGKGILRLDRTIMSITGPMECVDPDADIEDLLTHTSGIFDYYDEELVEDFEGFEVEIPWSKLETPSDYLPLFAGKKPKFSKVSPNNGKIDNPRPFSYSNGGYIMLGIIIEKITGQLFREVVRNEILEPAGMADSGFFPFNALPGNTALGYLDNPGPDGRPVTNIFQLPIRGASDGGMYTTAGDIDKFWRALWSGRLVSRAMLDRAVTPRGRVNSSYRYGYGLYIGELHGQRLLRMSGCDTGVGFDSYFIPELDCICTFLSNRTEGNSGLGFLVKLIAEQFV